jgi:XTP/dITP diphosphohydrolase
MPPRILVATGNRHKIDEIRAILAPAGVLAVGPHEIGGIPAVVEDGETFAANATKKARSVALATGWPVLADDSGLEVLALAGAPGVRSARYAGEGADDGANTAKLLRAMSGVTDRRARFVCVVAVARADGTVECTEGQVPGQIITVPRGRQGFGYDPVFVPDGYAHTFAELDPAEKNRISHRASALRTALSRGLLARIPDAPHDAGQG